MPYVGNNPAANFASVTKDLFSGDGSTVAFTLSKAATTNGVAVFVENVRQEPTIAYAVSGTTLTFTAAPVTSSGNNIYVLHHNAPASTANHPSAQALTATSGTFSSTLNATSGTFTANPGVLVNNNTLARVQLGNSTVGTGDSDGVQLQISGANGYVGSYDGTMNIFGGSSGTTVTGITVDANGHVTMPKQSAFHAYLSTAVTNIAQGGSETKLLFQTEQFDLNSDYNNSNSTFTAPVTGKYLFTVSVRLDQMQSNTNYNYVYFNTSNRNHIFWLASPEDWNGSTYYSVTGSVLADLDASDTCHIGYIGQGGTDATDHQDGQFCGYLVA